MTDNFIPEMLIGEGGNSEVYREGCGIFSSSNLQGGQIAAIKSPQNYTLLSDFGAAIVHQTQQVSADIKPTDVVRTFGYLAPEYMMYGKVDVYSYGVVLLELITGKEAIQTNQTKHESLARSLLSCGLCERLIDPYLNEDYKKEEMEIMMCVARLCLLHSSSRRPTMKTILRLFEEPEYWLKVKREKDELLNGIISKGETDLWRHYDESGCKESRTSDNKNVFNNFSVINDLQKFNKSMS
ncbi:hypothetical protein Patl1_35844 [Pistacia atlantica]|nr:hypothetical protein Patl1_35844 [Pistacia atlantica]